MNAELVCEPGTVEGEGVGRAGDALILDPVTRQRLAVAAATADVLEELVNNDAWDELDPVLAAHLRESAGRLRGFLELLYLDPTVRSCESEKLSVRRISRRLGVALDLVGGDGDAANGQTGAPSHASGNPGGALHLGDFSGRKLGEKERAEARRVREEKRRARRQLSGRALRIAGMVTFGLVTVAVSAFLASVTDFGSSPFQSRPELPFEANIHVAELAAFFPATFTLVEGDGISVVVDRQWLLEPEAERRESARAAQVWLSNRGLNRVLLRWDDGTVIASGTESVEIELLGDSTAAP